MTREIRDPLPDHARVAVLGLGRSGVAAARLLAATGHEVLASDTRDDVDVQQLDGLDGVEIVLGQHPLDACSAAVVSPGIGPTTGLYKTLEGRRNAGQLEIVAELELGFRATRRPIVAISGTDGKTTTTMLTAGLLRAAGVQPVVCGNIGTPLCEALLDDPAAGPLVVEVSAFQLLESPTFAPEVFITTNIAGDHMDYFGGDFEAYKAAKLRPLRWMTKQSVTVLNVSDPILAASFESVPGRVYPYGRNEDQQSFAMENPRPNKVAVEEMYGFATGLGAIEFCRAAGGLVVHLGPGETGLPGEHNLMNVMAAGLGAMGMLRRLHGEFRLDLYREMLPAALGHFELAPHRIQRVETVDGVQYVDDSKATNPHAASAGLRAVREPVVLIAGGVDKKLDLTAWVEAMIGRVIHVVCIGELAPRLSKELERHELSNEIGTTMHDAVQRAAAAAARLGAATVLLSPGCSSFDMFTSYAARGDAFREAVGSLRE